MSEQAPQYSEVIQEAVETEGVDIGRIKDKELAQHAATGINEDMRRNEEMVAEGWVDELKTSEYYADSADRYVKYTLAKKAVEAATGSIVHNTVVAALHPTKDSDDILNLDKKNLVYKARKTADEYDYIQDQAKLADRDTVNN